MTAPARVEERWRGWRKALLPGVYGILALVAAYEVVRAVGHPGDFTNFITFGEVVLDGRIPYDPGVEAAYLEGERWATWPPSFAPVAVALAGAARVARVPAVVGWQLLNLAGLAVLLAFAARWLYGRRLSLVPGPGSIPLLSLPMAVALFVPFRLVLSNFEHAQANLLIVGTVVAGFWLLREGRRWTGGLALGIATAFKGTPLLALPYLAWRGRWRDAGAAAAGCAVTWAVLPAAVIGPGSLPGWYRIWLRRSGEIDLRGGHLNQSLQAALTRLLSGRPSAADAGGAATEALPPALGAGWAGVAVLGIAAALAAGAALAYGRPGRGVGKRREALELGVVVAAMALFSPLAWKAHYGGLVLLAGALVAHTPAGSRWGRAGEGSRLPEPASAAVGVLLAAAFVLVNGTTGAVVGGGVSDALEAAGIVPWSTLALVVAGVAVLGSDAGGGIPGRDGEPGDR